MVNLSKCYLLNENIEDQRFVIFDYKLYKWDNFNLFHLVGFEKFVPKGEDIIDSIIAKYGSGRANMEFGLFKDYNFIRGIKQGVTLMVDGEVNKLNDRKNMKIIHEYAKASGVKRIIMGDENHRRLRNVIMESNFDIFEAEMKFRIQEHLKEKNHKKFLESRKRT